METSDAQSMDDWGRGTINNANTDIRLANIINGFVMTLPEWKKVLSSIYFKASSAILKRISYRKFYINYIWKFDTVV